MACLSSSPMRKKIYDVFISFRGEDTRFGFTAHLHEALRKRKIKTYIDEEDLSRGQQITPGLLEAIESSQLSVIVFSANYASSSWCLDELLHILECNDKLQQLVIPVFYHVEPSHVRKQQGSYKEAFDNHLQRFNEDSEQIQNWRLALERAAKLSGFSTQDPRLKSEPKLVDAIVEEIIKKLNSKSSFFAGTENLVGIEQSFDDMEPLLKIGSSDDIHVIGIWGRGGIGKTTLARFMFWKLFANFEGHCFLENVKEEWEKQRGESYLQNMLFSSVLGERDTNLASAFGIPTFVRDRLGRTKSLVVLDDVNEQEQLNSLVGCCKWFGPCSRIMVTSRDVQCLRSHLVNAIYEVKGLNSDEARQLFCLNASNKNLTYPPGLLGKVIDYAEGIPLVLEVLRSCFSSNGQKNWETLLDKLKSSRGGEKILNALMISYNDLSKRQKDVFLDIACFFKGWNRNEVERILEDQGFFVDSAIDDLVDKSLIRISYSGELRMHDLVQEMGQEVVRKQSSKPGERSRLWNAQEIYHVLKNNRVSEQIEGILLDVSKIKELHLSPDVFKRADSLRLLKIDNSNYCKEIKVHLTEGLSSLPDSLRCLDWPNYPLKSLPSSFTPEKLVHLNMFNSQVQKLWDGVQNLWSLKIINLSYSKNLNEIPDLSKAPNLETIYLDSCSSLSNVPSHKFQNLGRLRYLKMSKCDKLEALPNKIESAEYLSVRDCKNLRNIPEIKNENLSILDLSGSGIKQLPESIGSSNNISDLDLSNCKSLKNLPSSIYRLKLKQLDLSGCSSLEKIPEHLPKTLIELRMEDTAIGEILSSSIECLSRLEVLSLRKCKRLQNLPNNIYRLQLLDQLDLSGCSKFDYFPEILEPMKRLRNLNLSETSIRTLPSSFENLVALYTLDLTSCEKLEFEYSDNWLHSMKSIRCLRMCIQNLDLMPASIAKCSNLDALYLSQSINLKSLPELPLDLDVFDAEGCISLESVPSSRNIIIEGFHDKSLFHRHIRVSFFNCLNLDQNSRDNIIADSQLRILRTAIQAMSPHFKRNRSCPGRMSICYPGSEIPEWFVHQAPGFSIAIKLPPNMMTGDFLGFSLCFVAAFEDYNVNIPDLLFEVKFSCTTKSNEIHKFKDFLHWMAAIPYGRRKERFTNSDHVFMGLQFNKMYQMDLGNVTIVSIHLRPRLRYSERSVKSCIVKRCGVRVLSLKDVENLGISIPTEKEHKEEEDFPRKMYREHFNVDT